LEVTAWWGRDDDTYGENKIFESLIIDLMYEDASRVVAEEGIASHYMNHSDFS
jgi:hypothetical protein